MLDFEHYLSLLLVQECRKRYLCYTLEFNIEPVEAYQMVIATYLETQDES